MEALQTIETDVIAAHSAAYDASATKEALDDGVALDAFVEQLVADARKTLWGVKKRADEQVRVLRCAVHVVLCLLCLSSVRSPCPITVSDSSCRSPVDPNGTAMHLPT